MQVNHLDGNKHNNAISNLEYTTPSGNTQYALKNGWKKTAGRGRTLTPEEVIEIRSTPRTMSCHKLAAKYGTSHETIRSIWNGKRWKYMHDGVAILSDAQTRVLKRREGKKPMTPDAVREIRQRASSERLCDIAADYGYSNTGICDIVNRRVYAHIE
jgi:DNA-binding transcriptional regulator YiaG